MGELSLLLDRLRADLEPSRDTSSHGDSAADTGSCGGGALMRMRAPRPVWSTIVIALDEF